MNNNILSIVIPCYNEEDIIVSSVHTLLNIIKELVIQKKISPDSHLLFVDDGSHDSTWEIIEKLHQNEGSHVYGIKLSNNVGHQKALVAGLKMAWKQEDIIISIDADLQDDPSVITEMIDKYQQEGCEIVYGVRKSRRSDTFFKRITAQTYYKLLKVFGVNTIYNHADFRLMSSKAVCELCNYEERNIYLRGLVPLLGYRTGQVYYERLSRKAGKSKYSLVKMINFAIDGITSFSVKPVQLILSFLFIIISFFIAIYVLYSYLNDLAVPGWTFLMLSLWFVGGCILFSLGVIGEYIGKIYTEVKKRPLYHIERELLPSINR